MCEIALSKYPTTLEQDLQLLKENDGENEQNCIKLRIGEKEVIQEVIRFVDLIEKLFVYHPNVRRVISCLLPYLGNIASHRALPLQALQNLHHN